jgi:hypothetical protein
MIPASANVALGIYKLVINAKFAIKHSTPLPMMLLYAIFAHQIILKMSMIKVLGILCV